MIEEHNKLFKNSIDLCNVVKSIGKHVYKERLNGDLSCICGHLISLDISKRETLKKQLKTMKESKTSWINKTNFNILFKVAGMESVFSVCPGASTSSKILMQRFKTDETKIWIAKKDLKAIGAFHILLQNGMEISIQEMFENIEKNYSKIIEIWNTEEVLEIIAPGYERKSFKLYHALRIMNLYNELKEK